MKNIFSLLAHFAVMVLPLFVTCCSSSTIEVGTRISALDDSAWRVSKWISVADAPVATKDNNGRAADGATASVTLPGECESQEYGAGHIRLQNS